MPIIITKMFVKWYFDYKYYDLELEILKNKTKSLNASLARGNFCCLLITFANSLDQDQVRSFDLYLDPNYFDNLIGRVSSVLYIPIFGRQSCIFLYLEDSPIYFYISG